jgi:hypothetical protein
MSNVILLASLAVVISCSSSAELELVAEKQPQQVFGGSNCNVECVWRNEDGKPVFAEIATRILQASSGTTMPISVVPWKSLEVLSGQTVIENALVAFPAVEAETPFVVQWIERNGRVLGKTTVLVYPTNLLSRLSILGGGQPMGLLDPEKHFKALFTALSEKAADLQNLGGDRFEGKLAIVGPVSAKAEIGTDLYRNVKVLASKGVAVVWVQSPPANRDLLKPSFYFAKEGKGTVLAVQSYLVDDFAHRPQSQLNLIELARLAVHPELLTWPSVALNGKVHE